MDGDHGRGRPRFSVAIPLFNHAAFVGETVASVLAQDHADFEVVVSDNASTDASRSIVEAFADVRVTIHTNPVNVGFSPNLDRAVAMGLGGHVILMSSDDRMGPSALSTYAALLDRVADPERVLITAAMHVIDERGERIGATGRDARFWSEAVQDDSLTEAAGAPVWRVPSSVLLRRSLQRFRNPLGFCNVCFPRSVWERSGGYLGSRRQSPDKWFHWRILPLVDEVLLVDKPLFDYRRHTDNRARSRRMARRLEHLIDDYDSLLEITDDALAFAGVTRADLERAFVREAVAKRAMAFGLTGRRSEAIGYRRFARAVVPAACRQDALFQMSRLASLPGIHRVVPSSLVARRLGGSALHAS